MFQVLVVHELGRYARDEELGHTVFNRLQRAGVKLVNATSDVDYDSAEGRMMLSINLGLESYGSRKLSTHIKKSKRQRFEMGLHNGDTPFGCTSGASTRDALIPVPHEAEAVREAFRDYVAGAGYTEIARRWNALGLVPHSKQGKTIFTASTVQSVIENDFYAGFVGYKAERKRGIHDLIVSEDVFLAAQAKVRRHPSHAREPWTLSGSICSECGGPVWQSKSGEANDKLYYREASRQQQRDCSVGGASWRKELVEAEVDAVIREMVADPEWLAGIDREARRLPQADDDGRRAELLEDRRRANNAYFARTIDDAEFRRRTDAIEARLARLPVRPTTLVFAGERLLSIGQVWDGMTTAERREASRSVSHLVPGGPDEHAREAAVVQALARIPIPI
jgi:site-specific DNA recombinase